MGARRALAALALACIPACGPSNPVLGNWELDRQATRPGAVLAVDAADLEELSFSGDGVLAGDTEIPGTYVIEAERVRLVRTDGRGEHTIELLAPDRIEIQLPIGVTAVYVRAGG